MYICIHKSSLSLVCTFSVPNAVYFLSEYCHATILLLRLSVYAMMFKLDLLYVLWSVAFDYLSLSQVSHVS